MALPPKGQVIWDRRFVVEWVKRTGRVRHYPGQAWCPGIDRDKELPAFVQASLPAIVAEGRAIGLPYSSQAPAGLTCHFLGNGRFTGLRNGSFTLVTCLASGVAAPMLTSTKSAGFGRTPFCQEGQSE